MHNLSFFFSYMNIAIMNDFGTEKTDCHTSTLSTPNCCCNSLSHNPSLSLWGKKLQRNALQSYESKRQTNLKHHKVLNVEDNNILHNTSSKQTTYLSQHYTDSRHSAVNPNIPFRFTHQTSPSRTMKEYRRTYTYPNMHRRTVSALTDRQSRQYSSSTSTSLPHITATLRPKMIVLGEYCGEKNLKGRRHVAGREDGSELPPKPQRLINHSFSKKVVNKQSRPAIEYALSLKMRWVSQPIPSLIVQPSKSIDFGKQKDQSVHNTTSKTDCELHNKTLKKDSKKRKEDGFETHQLLAQGRGVCTLEPPVGTKFQVQIPNSEVVRSFTYNYMNHCQKRVQQARQDSTKLSSKTGSVLTIASPWSKERTL